MGNEVKRFYAEITPYQDEELVVLAADHDAVVSALRAENERLQRTVDEHLIANHKEFQRCERMRAELEALRSQHAERQEAVGHVFTMQPCFPGEPMRAHAQLHVALPAGTKLYTSPPPAQDVSGLVELLRDIAPFFVAPFGRDDLHKRIDAALAAYRNPATVKRCQTCTGTCAEICAKARP